MCNIKKARQIATAVVFVAILAALAVAHFVIPDAEVSVSERRKLAKPPALTAKTVFSRDYSGDLETYLLDQFPLRDDFRTLKAVLRFDLFRQKDNNGIYIADGSASKLETSVDEKHVVYCAETFEKIAAKYFSGAKLFAAIPPDKNAVLADANGYPSLDYDLLTRVFRDAAPSMSYIDLFGLIGVQDYYTTDSHWRQEALQPVLDRLSEALEAEFDPVSDYAENTLSPFYGVYSGQSALPLPADNLIYLTSNVTASALAVSGETGQNMPVYTTDRFSGMDGYDVFLGGAQALITIENPLQTNGRELVLVRDSFGSSLTPLLISGYERVVVVDLRYMSSSFIPNFIDTGKGANANRDVLFMLSSSMLNSTITFR